MRTTLTEIDESPPPLPRFGVPLPAESLRRKEGEPLERMVRLDDASPPPSSPQSEGGGVLPEEQRRQFRVGVATSDDDDEVPSRPPAAPSSEVNFSGRPVTPFDMQWRRSPHAPRDAKVAWTNVSTPQ